MSAISGTVGPMLAADAQTEAANRQAASSTAIAGMQINAANALAEQQRKDFAPFLNIGYGGLDQLKDYSPDIGMELPDYNSIVTEQYNPKPYTESEQYKALNNLSQKELSNRLAARGLSSSAAGANASAELTQKLIAQDYNQGLQNQQTDYGLRRNEQLDRYKALNAKYGTLRDLKNQEYDRITNLIKTGQGAASSISSANTQAGQSQQNALSNMSTSLNNAYATEGQGMQGLYTALGKTGASSISNVKNAKDLYDSVKSWWQKDSTGDSDAGSLLGQLFG